MNDQPVLPYAGTSGWSGSETSKQRAVQNDKDGTTKKRQVETLNLILQTGYFGMTWKELSDLTDWHHGTASGVLSVLDKHGFIVRLKETRNRCSVYVDLGFVYRRPIAVRKVKVIVCKNCGHEQ